MANTRRDAAKEAYWRGVVERQVTSGLSVRHFCRNEQLTESQFYAWRRTIAERDGDAQPAFVRAAVTKEAAQGSSIAIELPAGCVLRFSGSHATEQLADLVVALQSRCPR